MNPQPAMPAKGSLLSRLLRQVMIPLMLTWALGSIVAAGIASYFTQRAFDRSLLDDALLIASQIELSGGVPFLKMSDADLRTLLFDQSESEHFAILRPNGQLVAGHPGLEAPTPGEADEAQYADSQYQGHPVRIVTLTRDQPLPLRIVVATTTSSRELLHRQLVIYSVGPQLVLLMLLLFWLRYVVKGELRPLSRLEQWVQQRDASDLSPLPAPLISKAASRDIQSLAESINSLLARVNQALAAQREFAGNVAHELRTPLAGMRAAAEYGLAQTDPQRWREQLNAVLQSQQRASHLVDQLLALALANEVSDSIKLQKIRLDKFVREQVVRFLPRADKAGVELGASGLDEPINIMADGALMEGLLDNLLDNALRYGRIENEPASITVDLRCLGNEVWLTVSDLGPGIPVMDREALTARWKQSPSAVRLGEGAGLGLSIVQRYANILNARLLLDQGPSGRGLHASVIFSTPDSSELKKLPA